MGRIAFAVVAVAKLGVVVGLCASGAWAGLTLTSPVEYQVVQRSSRTGGVVQLGGSLTGVSGRSVVIQARLCAPEKSADWRTLAATVTSNSFTASLEAPAGGWRRLEVRALDGETVVGEAVVDHVGVGEVFVVAGQSNSANHGEEKQRPATGRVATFDGTRWRLADDPQPGASGEGGSFLPPFGDAMVQRFNVPVGIVSCGVGATSVREWLPEGSKFPHPPTLEGNVRPAPGGGWESKGKIFASFVARQRSLGPRGFRAVLWHQGESDANQKDRVRTLPGPLYREHLEKLILGSRRAIGWEASWFVAQVSYHVPGDEASPDIRAAQASFWKDGLAEEGPDSDALTGEMREAGGQGVHFSGPGLRAHAARWVEKVAPWLERQLSVSSGDAPQKILFLGNSITLHAPAPDIGWTGHWGMAASAEEKDYVHRLTARLAAAGTPPAIRVKNIAEFERGYDAYDIAAQLQAELAFDADLVVLAIGENVAEPSTNVARSAFSNACDRLMTALRPHRRTRLIVRGSFWPHPVKDTILKQAADRAGARFVDISALGRDEQNFARSERKIEHAGVAAHPGDRGMQAIADALYDAIHDDAIHDRPGAE